MYVLILYRTLRKLSFPTYVYSRWHIVSVMVSCCHGNKTNTGIFTFLKLIFQALVIWISCNRYASHLWKRKILWGSGFKEEIVLHKISCQSCWINRINKRKVCIMRQNSWKSLEQSECILGILRNWNEKSADTYIRSLKTWAKIHLIME
jgi:hypothetical protein